MQKKFLSLLNSAIRIVILILFYSDYAERMPFLPTIVFAPVLIDILALLQKKRNNIQRSSFAFLASILAIIIVFATLLFYGISNGPIIFFAAINLNHLFLVVNDRVSHAKKVFHQKLLRIERNITIALYVLLTLLFFTFIILSSAGLEKDLVNINRLKLDMITTTGKDLPFGDYVITLPEDISLRESQYDRKIITGTSNVLQTVFYNEQKKYVVSITNASIVDYSCRLLLMEQSHKQCDFQTIDKIMTGSKFSLFNYFTRSRVVDSMGFMNYQKVLGIDHKNWHGYLWISDSYGHFFRYLTLWHKKTGEKFTFHFVFRDGVIDFVKEISLFLSSIDIRKNFFTTDEDLYRTFLEKKYALYRHLYLNRKFIQHPPPVDYAYLRAIAFMCQDKLMDAYTAVEMLIRKYGKNSYLDYVQKNLRIVIRRDFAFKDFEIYYSCSYEKENILLQCLPENHPQ